MKSTFVLWLTILFSFIFINAAVAQKKVVIMGSSTARGSGASSYQLSWAGKLESSFNINPGDGLDTLFYNIALGGSNTYQQMPAGFTPPAGRPAPDTNINVTKALSYSPNVVIINLPSNDIAEGYSITETMDNFRLMYNTVTTAGAACYITTSQPRNDLSEAQRQFLLDTRDSITAQFGFFTINFWDDLVTSDGLNLLRDDRREAAGLIHPNDTGHDFLFVRVKDKNIFNNTVLKVSISGFNAALVNNAALVTWRADDQEPNTLFEVERSADGVTFEKLHSKPVNQNQPSSDYSFSDANILPGKSFYRLKIVTNSSYSYSEIISISNKKAGLFINKLYKDNASVNLTAELLLQKNEVISVSIVNMAGAVVHQRKQYVTTPADRVVIPITNLAQGQYYIRVSASDNNYSIKPFIK